MDPILGATLVGVGGSLLSNIFGSKSNSNANKTNLEIARMNNEWNYKMFQEQMAYNERMWHEENEYNTAVNQAQRLRAAGLNPAMVMSGQNAGTAGSAGGVTPPTAAPASVTPFMPDFSGVSNAMQNLIVNRRAQEQLQNDKERLRIESYDALGRFMANVSTSKYNDVRSQGEKIINQFRRENQKLTNYNLRADIGLKNAQRDLATKQAISVDTQNLIANKQLRHLDDLQKAQLDEISSRIALNYANMQNADEATKLTKENVKKVSEEVKKVAEETYGLKLKNDEAVNLAPFILRRAQLDAVPNWDLIVRDGMVGQDFRRHEIEQIARDYANGKGRGAQSQW